MFLAAIIYVFGALGINVDEYLSQLPEPLAVKIETKIDQGQLELPANTQARLDQAISLGLISTPAAMTDPRLRLRDLRPTLWPTLRHPAPTITAVPQPIIDPKPTDIPLPTYEPEPPKPTQIPLPTYEPEPPKPTLIPEPTVEPEPLKPIQITPLPLPSCPPWPPVDNLKTPSLTRPCLDMAL